MKETPLLFTPENAQKCFDGTKTQTRRLNGLDQFNALPDRWRIEGKTFAFDGGFDYVPVPKCPYGLVGDRLWVREQWAIGVSTGNSWHSEDGPIKAMVEPQRYQRRYAGAGTDGFFGKWRPSIHMNRWACRSFLDLTEIRVQRLQEISEEDAKAEGVTMRGPLPDDWHRSRPCFHCGQRKSQHVGTVSACFGGYGTVFNPNSFVGGFHCLWESINGPGSWAANPWVWCLSFKRVNP
ncbi:MAG: hypothetical protein ABT940_08345 [Alphaproteobacteria bacterium]